MTTPLIDRVRETTLSTGTNPVVQLSGAVDRYYTFAASVAIGTSGIPYVYEGRGNSIQVEEGFGTLLSATTFQRDTVTRSSNANGFENFAAGIKDFYSPLPASAILNLTSAPTTAPLALTGFAVAGTVGTPYTAGFQATGGTAPYLYSIVAGGQLPPGLSLDGSTGKLTGAPMTVGGYAFTVHAIDSASTPAAVNSAPQTVSIVAAPTSGGSSGTPYVALTGSRPLSQADNGTTLTYAGSGPITLTIPTGLTSFECAVAQTGTGVITVAASGVALVTANSNLATNGVGSLLGITENATDAFTIIAPGTASVTPTPTVSTAIKFKGILRNYGASSMANDFDSTNKVTMKMEAEALFGRVRMWVFSGTQLATSNWKFAVAPTDQILNDTVANATIPQVGGVSSNIIADASHPNGWRLGTWNGGNAASGLLYPSSGYQDVYDPFTSYLKESDIIVSDWIPIPSVLPSATPANGVKRPLLLARVVRLGTAGQTELNGSAQTIPANYAAWIAGTNSYNRMFFAQGGLAATDPIADPTGSPSSISPNPSSGNAAFPTVAFEFDYNVPARSVFAVGDSVTEAYNWPLQAIYSKSTPAQPWVCTNLGMSTHRWIEFAAYFRNMVKAGHIPTDILLPSFSINDSPQDLNAMALQQQKLLDLLELCERSNIHVYLWTAYHYPGTQAANYINTFARSLCAAGKATLVEIAAGFNASTMLLGDGVHPNATGQAFMAAQLLAAL